MKRLLLPLIALTFLVGACSSPTKPTAQSGPPKNTGTRATAWGELPTYDQTGQKFQFARRPPHPGITSVKPVTLDIVVNADGTVEDATVTESSGSAFIDRTALAAFIGARYSLVVGPEHPAPFVVRQQMTFTKEDASRFTYSDGVPWYNGKLGSVPEPGAPMNQAWSGAGGGWSGGGSYSNSSSSSN